MWTRYRKYLELRDNWHIQEETGEEGDALSSYYSDLYHRWYIARCIRCISKRVKTLDFRDQCYSGCPANTTCEWGICQCQNPNHIQIWGECVERGCPTDTVCHQELNSTLFNEEAEGMPCTDTLFCQEEDINLVCEGRSSVFGLRVNTEHQPFNLIGEDGNKVCSCRKEMKWNNVALECQVSSSIFSFQQEFVVFNVRCYHRSSLFVLQNSFPSLGVSWCWLFRREVHKLCQQDFQKHFDGRGQLPTGILRPIRD